MCKVSYTQESKCLWLLPCSMQAAEYPSDKKSFLWIGHETPSHRTLPSFFYPPLYPQPFPSLHQPLAKQYLYLVPVSQLISRSTSSLPKRHPLRPATRPILAAFPSPFPQQQYSTVYPPQAQTHEAGNQEARSRQQHPVFPHPKDQSCIFAVPTAPPMPPEESPWLFIILVPHQHSHPPRRTSVPAARISSPKDRGAGNRRGSAAALIFLPDDTEEKRTGTIHDCYVGELPIAVVWNQRFDDEGEEGVVGDGAHGIVGDTGWVGAANPGWVGEKRVEAAVATL